MSDKTLEMRHNILLLNTQQTTSLFSTLLVFKKN